MATVGHWGRKMIRNGSQRPTHKPLTIVKHNKCSFAVGIKCFSCTEKEGRGKSFGGSQNGSQARSRSVTQKFLETQMQAQPRPTESEALGVRPSKVCWKTPPRRFWCEPKFESYEGAGKLPVFANKLLTGTRPQSFNYVSSVAIFLPCWQGETCNRDNMACKT